MNADESRALEIPMRLLGDQREVDAIGQTIIEQPITFVRALDARSIFVDFTIFALADALARALGAIEVLAACLPAGLFADFFMVVSSLERAKAPRVAALTDTPERARRSPTP
jgi:hypothetical protein